MITIHGTAGGFVFRWGAHQSREFPLYKSCLRVAREFAARRLLKVVRLSTADQKN